MHPADTMLCFCSVVDRVVAGAVLAFLNADVPGSVHNDNERRVYIAIQVSPPPPPPLFALTVTARVGQITILVRLGHWTRISLCLASPDRC